MEPTLVSRAQAGDPAAQRELYDAHVDRIYRLAYRMTGDQELAREFTQDAFVLAFQRLDQFRGDSSLYTWLYTVASRVVMNGLRSIKRRRGRQLDLEDVPADVAATSAAEVEPDLRQRLHQAIDELPDIYRTAFVMYDVEGYKHHEIGAALGIPTGTSKARLSRARELLREALTDYAEEFTA